MSRAGGRGASVALALMLTVLCSGCISFKGEFGTPIPVDVLQDIREGETTREEIHAWFGPPSALYSPTFLDVVLEDVEDITGSTGAILDDVYTYRFIQNDTTLWFIPIFFASLEALPSSETLTIFFDEQGRVRYHAYRRDGPGAGGR
jgi:hypothetical protein